jgi:hypothetical protein
MHFSLALRPHCDEIIHGGSGALILTSGTYVLQKGISVAESASISATGPVALYVTGGNVSLAGSTGVNLSPPTSGAYQGIFIWQPSSNAFPATIVGGATQGLAGLVYMPTAQLTYTGNSSVSPPRRQCPHHGRYCYDQQSSHHP